MNLPSPTPNLTQSLSPQECDAHRARIGVEVEIVLDGFWQTRPSPEIKAGILADWMDVLEDWHIDQIRAALRAWRRTSPDKKPNPGHILRILKRNRGRAYVDERDGLQPDPVFAIERQLMVEAT